MDGRTDKNGCLQFSFFHFLFILAQKVKLNTFIILNLRRLVMSLEIKQTIKELNQKLEPFKGYL